MLSMAGIFHYDSNITVVMLRVGARECVRGGLGKVVFVLPVCCFLLL